VVGGKRSAEGCRAHGRGAHTEQLACGVGVDERLALGRNHLSDIGHVVRDDGFDLVANGRIPERVPDQLDESTLAKVRALNAVAAGRGQSLAQLAIAWVLREATRTPAV